MTDFRPGSPPVLASVGHVLMIPAYAQILGLPEPAGQEATR